jgi:hypothetical protein
MTEEEKQQNEETTEETPEAAAEEKPKPRRARRKKAAAEEPVAEEAAADEVAEEEPEAEEASAEEPVAEQAEEPAAEEEEKKSSRRRRSADAAPAASAKKTPAPRAADGTVVVRAQAKYVRHAPRKARLVVDHIRGKSVEEARAILNHTPRAAAGDVLKLLNSAVANEGPTLKRYRPRALGRATRIRKRTSHMTIQLSPKE